MYQIDNPQEFYVYWYGGFNASKPMYAILENEKELIKFIAQGYVETYDSLTLYHSIDRNRRFDYMYTDGYNRNIEPRTYKSEAWEYYRKFLKSQDKPRQYIWWKNKTYKGEFRREPVEGIHKPKGWRCGRNRGPRMKQIVAMYHDPEQKEFNRGNTFWFPWWDDVYRVPQKCWKEQRKTRHQWKVK